MVVFKKQSFQREKLLCLFLFLFLPRVDKRSHLCEVLCHKFQIVLYSVLRPLCSHIVADLNARNELQRALCMRALFFFSTRRVFYSTPENNNINNNNNNNNNNRDDETMLRGGDSLFYLSLLRMATSRRPREDKGREEEDDFYWC